ncbi:MAG: Mrp/NBP35 family ATP-binding protein [Deltaproteobacteria bacterium]|nr:Mrp/NBP35 family ATP-binding protein [Deltaproteobacteria bacterium]
MADKKAIPGVSNIIAVSSGKGGVGKSTVAVNLACALKLSGARVGLMDADVYGPNIPTMMGVSEQLKLKVANEEILIPPENYGIKVMSMGFLIKADQPLIWRGPMLHSVVNQFCYNVDWGTLDYLIVDMPPGTGDVQLSLAQLVPVVGALLVTTPQEVSMQDVRKAFYMFEKVHIPVLGVVENMSYFVCDGCQKKHYIFGNGGGTHLAEKLRRKLLAEIPIQNSVCESGDCGKPITMQDPASLVSSAYQELAKTVIHQVAELSSEDAIDPAQIVQIEKFY